MSTITDFRSRLAGGGARPSLFKVILNFPAFVPLGPGASRSAELLVKAASLPATTMEKVPVDFQGRKVNLTGEKNFEDWTITAYNDTDFLIRDAFEQWMEGMNGSETNAGLQNPSEYVVDMVVIQLDRNQQPIKTYSIKNAFPTSVGAIELDYSSTGQIETFQVTLAMDYFTSVGVNA
jgi:hypothetical protein